MNDKKRTVSKRLREIREWKEAIYREVADLPTDEAMKEIQKKARAAADKVDLPHHSPARTHAR